MSVPGEKTQLTVTKQLPEVLVEWSGGLPPFQLQRTLNLEVIDWQAVGNPTLARSRALTNDGFSAFFRIQSEVPQFSVDLTGPQTRLYWDVPDLGGSSPTPDIYPWPFPGVKPEGWRQWEGGNNPATWNYQENPIAGHQSIGFSVEPPPGTTPVPNPYSVGADYTWAQAYPEFYCTFLFKSMKMPQVRGIEICDLYDWVEYEVTPGRKAFHTQEMCNIYLYPAGGPNAGCIALFMREGYGGITSPIPMGQDIRIWLHYKQTPTGSVSDVAWALPNEQKPTSGPQVVNGGNSTVGGPIKKLLFGPVDTGVTFVYADLKAATFPLDNPGTPDTIDHFVLSRRVPEALAWEAIAQPGAEVREYIDPAVPSPSFDYWLRGVTTQGQEWDYTPIIRVTEQNPAQFIWQHKIGSTSPSGDTEARGVAFLPDGSVAVAGYFSTRADFGSGEENSHGGYDGYVVKYSSGGNHLWHRIIGGSDTDFCRSIASDSAGNVYILGSFQSNNIDFEDGHGPRSAVGSSDIFLLKLNGTNGSTIWVRHFPGGGIDRAFGVTVDTDDYVVICGAFGGIGGTIDLGFGPVLSNNASSDCFVAKYAPDAVAIWAKTFGGPADDQASSVAIDPLDNSVVVTGKFQGTMIVDGVTLVSPGGTDIFLARWSASGVLSWAKRYGSTQTDGGEGVSVRQDGSIALVGNFMQSIDFGNGISLSAHGNSDMFLAVINIAGVTQWAKNWGTNFGGDTLLACQFSPDNSVVITGFITGFIDMGGGFMPANNGQDVLLAKFSIDGDHIWSRRYGGVGFEYGNGVAVDPNLRVASVGAFANAIDFGGGPLTSNGQLKTSYVVLLTG